MAKVRLRNVQKRFADGTVAVHDLSLDIEDREFLTFLGPSGCGKTTTLRMVAGLETLSGGEILFDDDRIDDLEPGERNIAMVFQSYALYPHMTVAENMGYPLRKRGVAKAERARRVAETARLLQIDPLLGRRPRQLSGGQQQRVALGRAIIREPEVFLLDEPLSNLDATLRAYMRAELIQLHRRLGKTMLYVTHDQVEAMTMSSRIAVMHGGRLQQVGTPDEVYNTPANRVVAAFVGTPAMNFIEGEITGAPTPGFSAPGFAVPVAAAATLRPGMPVTAGIRPEDVHIGEGEGTGQVLVVEPLGHETLVVVAAGGGNIVVRCAPGVRVGAGETVPLRLAVEKLHLFDGATGMRLLS